MDLILYTFHRQTGLARFKLITTVRLRGMDCLLCAWPTLIL